ncbi:fungal specific transcription factor domain-containing protein [Pyrenophora tritici-repentis]|nr:fungal specific transcription factor domain-containing protein [Pyrenophora tritici-repentis]KAI1549511.1 fungal specific transcription factor domain-containing protein [Pyrenophora tritici-repentis]KAI1553303.1 fungal specific transcription factor domain-containing protein [Pyrenophora tritici-repentis]KAI1558382.1 fungal specific transcription factor domain-containing protein [Pyrenophora tritici-repentis]KAI1587301.1 fungal specific transcription factor domain-containing protein [Pyrenoph
MLQSYLESPLSPSSSQGATADTVPAANTEAPSNITNSQPSAARKPRVALACKRCKRRKQRCDGARPVCRSCERAGVACAYERTLRPQYPGGKSVYINALEERIAFLEARLPDHAEDHYDNGPEPLQNGSSMSTEEASTTLQPQSSVSRSRRESREDCFSEDHEGDDRTSLVDGVAYLSLCASGTTDTTSEPYYVGSSSGATIARIIQSSIFRSSSKRSGHPPIHQTDQSSKNARPPPPPESIHSEEPTTDFPDWQQARMLFDVFFERIHTRWPLLDRVVYTKLFDKQYIQGALTIIERSIFHLIYAITARFLSLTRKPCGIDSDRHLVAATEPMDYILAQHNLATVQFLILLGVHGQRSPYGAGAWSQIRYATSVCIEMGLHRKRAFIGSPEQARDAEIRRRAFWACYCLDRVTSIVLGRAFAIADRDINVELPSTSPEFWTLTHTEAPDADKVQWSNIEPYIHIIKLDQIQSRIHRTVFRVDRDVFNETSEQHAKLDRKMAKIRADLDEWLRTYPQTPKKENKITWMYDPESAYLDARDFYGVQYHKAMLFLFTVFLPTLDTSDVRFITCARSAACVCNAYKRLSQNRTLTYTMISLHSCFVAGLTLVYCIWRERSLFSYDVLEATRACSQILTIFGEKWPGAVKYRDIFDALSGSLFKTVVNSTSTTTVHTNGSRPLQLDMDAEPAMNGFTSHSRQASHEQVSQSTSQSSKPTLSHLVTDAVKEAFMEVDEEAPGGWQGWRMWNEMVRDDSTPIPGSAMRFDGVAQGQAQTSWNAYEGSAFYGVDPIQDATMQMDNGAMMDSSQWNFGVYR